MWPRREMGEMTRDIMMSSFCFFCLFVCLFFSEAKWKQNRTLNAGWLKCRLLELQVGKSARSSINKSLS